LQYITHPRLRGEFLVDILYASADLRLNRDEQVETDGQPPMIIIKIVMTPIKGRSSLTHFPVFSHDKPLVGTIGLGEVIYYSAGQLFSPRHLPFFLPDGSKYTLLCDLYHFVIRPSTSIHWIYRHQSRQHLPFRLASKATDGFLHTRPGY